MPRNTFVPRYTLHKASGLGRVRFQGRDIYFGPYDAPESRQRYARFVAELATRTTATLKLQPAASSDLLVSEMILQYLLFAKEYYGSTSREPRTLRDALRPVNELYGGERARNFGPLALKTVRNQLVQKGLCRAEINRRMTRIKRAFKWAVSEELIPTTVIEGLRSVDGLRRGRSAARESVAVRPVDAAQVEATLKFLSPPVAAICQIQMLTGMRPSEVVQMRRGDIDQSQEIWLYKPATHKTIYLGIEKKVPLGPQAQAVLTPFMNRPLDAFLFTPAEAEAWRQEQRSDTRRSRRTTRVYPSELKARQRKKESARTRNRERPFLARYSVGSYRRALSYAFRKAEKAGVSIQHWFPYQIRHSVATIVRRKYGLEAAQVALGHSTADVTQVYAERNLALAIKVAQEIG